MMSLRHFLAAFISDILKLPDPCCDSVRAHTVALLLIHKNPGVTHLSGHYWPNLPNHWELDPLLAEATRPGPNINICHFGIETAPSLFHQIPVFLSHHKNIDQKAAATSDIATNHCHLLSQ